ncbi:hypothetical protein AQUCO_07600142v1 [Aquilegia coerulea]|uniref:Bromo domain-containing protein n=1 Tax=Aquilegia coerulea TaxID=218851 RepID=A0A2G5C921_AQUCA|nr:hypothetical protein AQUCO_07600142v1 [Aquilegia coerulea]
MVSATASRSISMNSSCSSSLKLLQQQPSLKIKVCSETEILSSELDRSNVVFSSYVKNVFSMEPSVSHSSNKRGPVTKLETQQVNKKQKIDSKVMVHCLALLNKLINDRRAWGFRNPVDPVAMNIPDYFSFISEPMDLGTIKSKLEKKLYMKTGEFAADVRLTFNNAMLYNPPANYFHVVAKELSELFESKWKVLDSNKSTQQLNSDESSSTTLNMKQDSHTTQAKLQKVMRSCHHSRPVESAHTQHSSGQNSSQKYPHGGIGDSTRHASVSVSYKSRTSSACLNGSCKSTYTRVGHQNSFSSSDVCVIDEDNCHPSSPSSTPCNDAALDEGWKNSLCNGHLSPSKALRAAMLRSRFADTIVKAQHKILLNNGGKSDPVMMKGEKERLEKQQREEQARIEAQIRAAEAASRMREEMESKMQREREREAARIALQKMERTVEIYENWGIWKDLEMLGACSERDYFLVHNDNTLERLGLFMKDEYLEDQEELETCSQVVEVENCSANVNLENDNADLEEGEINLENDNADLEEGEITWH